MRGKYVKNEQLPYTKTTHYTVIMTDTQTILGVVLLNVSVYDLFF